MPVDRRWFLGGVVTVGAALAGCNSGGDEQRVPDGPGGSTPAETTDEGPGQETFTEVDGVLVPGVNENMIEEWSESKGEDGNLTLSLELRNIDPAPIEGTLKATFATRSGESKQFSRDFTLPAEDTGTVTMSIPVSYEEYNANMSQPDFTITNLTEQ